MLGLASFYTKHEKRSVIYFEKRVLRFWLDLMNRIKFLYFKGGGHMINNINHYQNHNFKLLCVSKIFKMLINIAIFYKEIDTYLIESNA